jgi:hypothetical protein
MAYLRGPTVSYNIQNGDFNLYTAVGQVDITVPADWDNTSSFDPWTFSVTGGWVLGDEAPDGLYAFIQMSFVTVDGGSAITADVSSDGLGYLPGAVVRYWGTFSMLETWETAGLDQTGTLSFDPTQASSQNATLIDGTAYGFPGDGFVDNAAISPIQGPIGWAPSIINAGASTGPKLQAGQTVTLGLSLYGSVDNDTFPDRTAWAALQSITATYKGTSVEIPITDVWVGFGGGGPVSPYPSSVNPDAPYDFNALRAVNTSVPPESTFSQDLFLEGVVELMVYFIPPGKQTFFDPDTGHVAALGTVGMYEVGTMTPKDTWSNEAQTELNINPIPLDGGGQCIIWGDGLYRQIFKRADGTSVWDKVTGG